MEHRRFRLVTILPAALLVVAVAAPAASQLALTLNQTAFHAGEVVEVTLAVRNDGPAFSADVYVGARLPDGNAVFLTTLSPPSGIVMTPDADPGSVPPLRAGVIVPGGLDTTIPDLLSIPFSDQELRGAYGVFATLARAGALQDGRIDPGDLVASAVQPFTFVDTGTGLSTAAGI